MSVGCKIVSVVVWLFRASALAAVTASGVVTTGNAWTIAESVGFVGVAVVSAALVDVADAIGEGVGGTTVAVGAGVVGVAVGWGVGADVAVAGTSASVAVGVTTAKAATAGVAPFALSTASDALGACGGALSPAPTGA